MHMPPDPSDQLILACQTTAHHHLWKALSVPLWPLPLHLLPPGSALVGGAVRDGLIGRLGVRPDLDLVVPGDGLALASALARQLGGTAVALDRERAIGRLVLKGWTIDLARQEGDSLGADLHRRDFTVNAMALRLPLGEQTLALIDPLHGLGDLKHKILRAIGESNLLEDPLRLLRGVRLAAELGFTLTDQTWEWILRHRSSLTAVAGERVLAELQRLVESADAARGVELLLQSGLLEGWTSGPALGGCPPGAMAHLTVEQARVRGLTEEEAKAALPIATLARLLDGNALVALRASNRLRQRCRHLRRWRRRLLDPDVHHPQGFQSLPESEQLELHRQVNGDLPALLLELTPAEAHAALQRWRDPQDPLFHPQAPLDGLRLQQELSLPPGPRLGDLLAHLTRERAFGRLPRQDPTGEQSLRAARRWLEATGGPCHD